MANFPLFLAIWYSRDLKCHWDQNFGIPYFCIFENSLLSLVTMPNFNSLRRLEVAFFGRFLSRFYGRHYRPLFRKLACELAEVTLEAHLKPSQASFRGKFNCCRANCLLYGLEMFVAAAVMKGITCVVQCYNNKSNHRAGISLHQSLASGPAMEKWITFVLTHSANINPRGIFVGCSDHFTDECFQRAAHVEGSQRSIIPLSIPTIWKERSGKNETKGT